MNSPLSLAYGVFVLGFTYFAASQGWTLFSPRQSNVSPKTVRDNPGAYRSTYGGYTRYTGGK